MIFLFQNHGFACGKMRKKLWRLNFCSIYYRLSGICHWGFYFFLIFLYNRYYLPFKLKLPLIQKQKEIKQKFKCHQFLSFCCMQNHDLEITYLLKFLTYLQFKFAREVIAIIEKYKKKVKISITYSQQTVIDRAKN